MTKKRSHRETEDSDLDISNKASVSTNTSASSAKKSKNSKKSIQKSVIWQHSNLDNKNAILLCNYCSKKYVWRESDKYMLAHLIKQHNIDTTNNQSDPETDSEEAKNNVPVVKKSLQDETDEALVGLLVSTSYSYERIVGNIYFRELIRELKPDYEIPSKAKLRAILLNNKEFALSKNRHMLD